MTRLLFALLLVAGSALAADRKTTQTKPPGEPTKAETKGLKAGAHVLQSNAPLERMQVYLVGFHPMKDDPSMQMEAHHFCNQVNEDFAQCVLFDGNTADANMNGVEYIISEKLFDGLPEEEKQLWHPHDYEIFSGQLVAPGIPDAAERELMKGKVNSYGKTWHFWMTGGGGMKPDSLPLGLPHLAWSFNRDGEAKAGLVEERDRAMGIDSGKKRKERAEFVNLARPQRGVDDLKSAFPNAGAPPAGVKSAGPAGGVPRCTVQPAAAKKK